MWRARTLLAGLVVACCACASIESKADRVRVVSDEGAVSRCSFRGFVASHDSATTSETASELREKTVAQGGNVVLLLSEGGPVGANAHASGEAYFCSALSLAQNPASFVPAEQSQRLNSNGGPYCPPSID
jgi:hypothetical protein